ncbi:DUF2267 domain-containing protein [Glycomyces sp. YM15]|uniref:DUF2267 domain-containing protein n=1 Tax=Glycomyces sp. YM15 TaxID=2800446 RepID=UPI001965C6A8|nr:DUF2267 domain-containing protein [Glycomyces sp. YM15]
MQHDQFIGQLQARAHLSSRGEAERAARATLETLGERITDQLAHKLASQLPPEIGEHLHRYSAPDGHGTGEHFGFNEFAHRVAEREHAKEPEAVFHARAVFELLGEGTTGGIMDHVRESLPPDLRPLVDAGSRGGLNHG